MPQASPLAAFLAAMTAFSSGGSATLDAAIPAGSSFPRLGEMTGQVTSPIPPGAVRVADANRIVQLMQGELVAVSNRGVRIETGPGATATGAVPVTGADGCGPFAAKLVVTDQGALALGNAHRQVPGCPGAADDQFWKVFSGQVIMYVTDRNIVYLTDGVDGIQFFKTR